MLDLGVDPPVLATSLTMVIAQRLVRRICSECREEYEPGEAIRNRVGLFGDPTPVFRGRGCTACGGTGFNGRIGIYEIYRPTTAIRKLINDRASEADLRYAARQAGMVPLREDALAKIRAGVTSPDEVLRVVQIDENEVPCPGCKALIETDFASCPYCRKSLKTNCTGCGQPLRLEWSLCPYCNTNALAQPLAKETGEKERASMPSAPMPDDAPFEPRPQVHDEGDSRPVFDLPEVAGGEQYIGPDLDAAVGTLAPTPASPPAATPPPAPPPKPAADQPAGQRPLRVLVVDDDPDIRMIVSATLRKMAMPIEVVQAQDGFEALEKARETPPDLVVLDVMMPHMDGFEACRGLRNNVRTAFVPILMLTASADHDSRTKGYLIGTDDYLSKPFLPVDLKLRVARLLRRTYGI
jgi:CheY-like chemotaxis protein